MEQSAKPAEPAKPKSNKTMYGVIGAVVVIVIVVLALYLAGIFPGGSTPPANTASAKIFDTGSCSGSSNCDFSPYQLNVTANTKVTWTSNSTTAHTVTECTTSSTSCPQYDSTALSPTFDSGVSSGISNGGTYSYTFKTAGTYYYYCQYHSWMHGKVSVSA